MTIHIQEIALSKLVPSKANVRRTGRGDRIEELAASIAAHGLLQNLTVRSTDKEKFEVIAGGRRLTALKLLVKRKEWAKDAPILCQIIERENVTEISLAENALQCPMHPADQFEAFAALHRQEMSVEDIAARFGVAPQIVTQRLKLGAVSPKLMDVYREGKMNLDQLSAFAITDDHKRQEQAWQGLGYERSRRAILRALSEGQVSTDDCRALYIGPDAYMAAGGSIIRDLFDAEGGGYFENAALLNRLVEEKLGVEADSIRAEGWHWVQALPEFDHALARGMRRMYPQQRAFTEAEEARLAELTARYEALEEDGNGEDDEAREQEQADIDREMDAIHGADIYDEGEKAIAGAFVTIGYDGTVRVERGFIRGQDDPTQQGKSSDAEAEGSVARKAAGGDLPARLVAELTAHRTAALSNELALHPDVALVAVVHALTAQTFYAATARLSCLKLDARKVSLSGQAEGIAESRALAEMETRHGAWEQRMPENVSDLWRFVYALADGERLALLAHCASLTLDAVRAPNGFGGEPVQQNAETLVEALALDMSAYWQPTAGGYFGRVAKPVILRAVREGASPEAAQTCEAMKKPEMAQRAEKLLAGTNWLPEILRKTAA